MKTFLKTLLATSVLAIAGSASAATINVSVYGDAAAAERTFLDSLSGTRIQENFDSLGGSPDVSGTNQNSRWENKSDSFSTAVGTFTMVTPGQSGSSNLHSNELMIESDRTGESGRDLGLVGGQQDFWLDSNDAKNVSWHFDSSLAGNNLNAFGFYLSDAADVSGTLTLKFTDGNSVSYGSNFVKGQRNGNLKYVTVTSTQSIVGGTFTFNNSASNDGWGIDNATLGTVKVPEPGTLLLMGIGLLGLAAARRRVAK